MKAIIWDLDGTLVNSYDVIIQGLKEACKYYGKDYSFDYLLEYVKKNSMFEFLNFFSSLTNVPPKEVDLKQRECCKDHNKEIKLIPGAIEILDYLISKGYENIIVTSRGVSTYEILDNLGLSNKFIDVITDDTGMKRKPDPESMEYLVKKYKLNKDEIYYVGDRNVDIEYGYNSKIKTIMYLDKDTPVSPNPHATFVVDDLLKIKEIIK